MLQIIDTLGVIFSLIGAILIVKKLWYGYIFWCISNICWVIIGISVEAWGQVFTFGIMFMIINIWGIYEWKLKKKYKLPHTDVLGYNDKIPEFRYNVWDKEWNREIKNGKKKV
jgi:nicotinamide riboside transporter PnuC